jgi:hypothetical protein
MQLATISLLSVSLSATNNYAEWKVKLSFSFGMEFWVRYKIINWEMAGS